MNKLIGTTCAFHGLKAQIPINQNRVFESEYGIKSSPALVLPNIVFNAHILNIYTNAQRHTNNINKKHAPKHCHMNTQRVVRSGVGLYSRVLGGLRVYICLTGHIGGGEEEFTA